MANIAAGDNFRFKRVAVDFEGAHHNFRLVPNYTFAHLLSDSTKHWLLEEEDYELQDEDGCTWPSAGVVVDMLLAERALEDFPQSSELLVFLKPLETFGHTSSPHFTNPPPSLASSFSSFSGSFNTNSTLISSGAMAIPASPLSRSLGSSHHSHHRTPSKSDAVRKLIEENRLAPPIASPSFSVELPRLSDSSISFPDSLGDYARIHYGSDSNSHHSGSYTVNTTHAFHQALAPHPEEYSSSQGSQLFNESPQSSGKITSSFTHTEIKLSRPHSVPPHLADLSAALADSSAPSLQQQHHPTGFHAHPNAHTAHPTSNAKNSIYNEPGSAPAIVNSHLLGTAHVHRGYTRRGDTTEMAPGSATLEPIPLIRTVSASPSGTSINTSLNTSIASPPLSERGLSSPSEVLGSSGATANKEGRSGIRLRKAYDNVTVNEVLSDPRIQLAPTTHKDVTLEWDSPPTTVLIIKKRQEPGITELLRAMAIWLKEEKGIKVLIEPSVSTELPDLMPFSADDPDRYPDFIICLGGDGTVLHANTLFQNSMPPLMAFSLGSLGFLTPFRVRKYKQSISGVLNECKVTLRSRLFCVVVKHEDGVETVTKRTVLNEVVIDRGYSPYLSNLECFCDNVPITNIQADGIIISSTTGSTAYSLSAGGSMVHPQMPAILFTPICPHSLSFRPLIFPDSVELKIQVPNDSRSTAWASFDGREQTELHRGDYLIIRVSKWPFVWIRESDGVGDWFKSLADCLHWNDRRKQKPVSASLLASTSSHSQTTPPPSSSRGNP